MTSHFLYGICVAALVSLLGCAVNPREASPDSFAQYVKASVRVVGQDSEWRGPVLQVRHYRTLFYGYDSVDYWLVARKSPTQSDLYELLIRADYGGELRHYDTVKFADGSNRPTINRQHNTERCQFFNNLVYACLFVDQVSVELSQAELVTAKAKGLGLTLSSGMQDYESIDLPAQYLQGFLLGIEKKGRATVLPDLSIDS